MGKIRNMLIRTVKTFFAAFLGSVIPMVPTMLGAGYSTWQAAAMALIAAGVAAGITAVMNIPFVKKFFYDYGEVSESEGK